MRLRCRRPGVSEEVAEAEEIAQDVAEIGEGFGVVGWRDRRRPARPHGRSDRKGALLRIAQDTISLARLFEFFFGCGIVRIAIGMIAFGEFAIGAFNLLIAGSLADTQYFVIVSLRHGVHCGYGLTATLTIAGLRSFPLKLYPR